MEVRFKYKGWTDGIQGVVFGKNGYSFNGSKIDRQFSYSKIAAALNRNSFVNGRYNPAGKVSARLQTVAGSSSAVYWDCWTSPFILHRESGESRIPPADATEEEKEEEEEQGI